MRAAPLGFGIATLAAMAAGAAPRTPLDAHRWRSRVLVLSAPEPGDARLGAQRAALAASRAGVGERDLVVLEAIGDGAEATALRTQLGLPRERFRAVLVGKDGGTKLSADAPIPSETLFSTIDAMPMRRDEMRR